MHDVPVDSSLLCDTLETPETWHISVQKCEKESYFAVVLVCDTTEYDA